MDSNTRWMRVADAVLLVALSILSVGVIVDLVDGTADSYSAWDWALAALLLVLLAERVTTVVRRSRRRVTRGQASIT